MTNRRPNKCLRSTIDFQKQSNTLSNETCFGHKNELRDQQSQMIQKLENDLSTIEPLNEKKSGC